MFYVLHVDLFSLLRMQVNCYGWLEVCNKVPAEGRVPNVLGFYRDDTKLLFLCGTIYKGF